MVRSDAVKNRAHILTVARAMMEEENVLPSLNALAKEAGVGVATVYRHFADEQALLAGLGESHITQIEALIERVRAQKDPALALEMLLREGVAMELSSPAFAMLLASPRAESKQLTAQLSALEQVAEAAIARGRKAKVFRADLKPGDVRRLLCGIERAISASIPGDDENAASRYIEIVLAGLRR